MSEKLTLKQEKFVQNLIKGMSQREAYRNAYNNNKTKDEIIDTRACELFKNSKVKVRYEELLKRLEDKAIMSAEERMKWLSKVIKADIKVEREYDNEIKEYDPYMSDRLKAMDILNKMDGQYTTKREGNISVEKIEDVL